MLVRHNHEKTRECLRNLQSDGYFDLGSDGKRPMDTLFPEAALLRRTLLREGRPNYRDPSADEQVFQLRAEGEGLTPGTAPYEQARTDYYRRIEEWEKAHGTPENGSAIPESPFEHPAFDKLFNGYADIFEATPTVKDLLQFRPLIGMIPSGSLQGCVMRCQESNEYILGIHDGAGYMINQFSQELCRLLFGPNLKFRETEQDLEEVLKADPDILQRLLVTTSAVVIYGHPTTTHRPVDGPAGKLANQLGGLMEMFLLAHEYGHLVCGHLNQPEKWIELGPGLPKVSVHSKPREFEADQQGFLIINEACGQEMGQLMINWAPLALFLLLALQRRARFVIETGRRFEDVESMGVHILTSTHPDPLWRFCKSREFQDQWLAAHHPGEAQHILGLGDITWTLVDFLSGKMQPYWVAAHQSIKQRRASAAAKRPPDGGRDP